MCNDILNGKRWHIHHGDCIEHMPEMPDACVDFSVFSPPFPSLYAYTDSECDIGNSEDMRGDAKLHLSFFYHQFARILKPGRVVAVHVMQIPKLKRSGDVGLHDFRGLNIRLGERAGLIYEYDWLIPKNPQAQAIRTKSRELDYIIKFRTPGENEIPVKGGDSVSRNDWIDWAEAAWYGIKETDTLNVKAGRDEKDTKHICPLQLPVISRLVRLFTNPDEIVFSPFAGIGSEGESLKLGRRFYGCELKRSYYLAARENCRRAVQHERKHLVLFS